ncbi:hypothetical protein FACS189499_08550 [Clostridia bacterium]|nr:hypothetical protein FACS189499_08550 [Clostridia bacterium]
MHSANGIYNLKFISKDGKYEAVYNKDGILLTAENDPVNMGTYNYANPNPPYLTILQHQSVDVNPYYVWGNVNGVPNPKESDLDNLLKYAKNSYAKTRWEALKVLLG